MIINLYTENFKILIHLYLIKMNLHSRDNTYFEVIAYLNDLLLYLQVLTYEKYNLLF